MKRIVYRVTYVAESKSWKVQGPGQPKSFTRKYAATKWARKTCRELWKGGQLAQLVVHKRNGRIQDEFTYGKDPRRTKG